MDEKIDSLPTLSSDQTPEDRANRISGLMSDLATIAGNITLTLAPSAETDEQFLQSDTSTADLATD